MSGKPATAALGKLGRPEAFREVVDEVAASLPKLVDQGFVNRTEPNRTSWAKRKDDRTHPILELTRRMRTTVLAAVFGTKIRLTTAAPYLKFHQHGTRKMAARPLAPRGKMTPDWLNFIKLRVKTRMRDLQRAK